MNDVGPVVIVMVVVVVVTEILNPHNIVVTMMGMTVDLWLMSVVAMLVQSGLMAMMAMVVRWKMVRQLNHSWVMESVKLRVRNGMHESLLFHFLRSSAVPHLTLCKPS